MSDLRVLYRYIPEGRPAEGMIYDDSSELLEILPDGTRITYDCWGNEIGLWVPDTRLQAIAEAWDEVRETGRDNVTDEVEWFRLESLLDALVERGSE